MRTLMPVLASLLPLLALLMVGSGARRAAGAMPPTSSPRNEPSPVDLPAESAIRCPLDHKDAGEKKEGEIHSLAYSHDGKTLAAGNVSGFVKLFDPKTGRLITSFRTLRPFQGRCGALAFAPDGRALAAEIDLDRIALFDPATGATLRVMEPPPFQRAIGVKAITFSPDGKSLAVGYGRGEVILWEVASGRRLHLLPPHIIPAHTNGPFKNPVLAQPAGIYALAFSPDGATLYTSGIVIRAWDFATGQERPRPEQAEGATFYSIAVSPDGATLAASHGYQVPAPAERVRSITLWDAATGRKRADLPTTELISALAFLPGGRALVALEGEKVLRLWDLATGHSTAAVRFEHHFELPKLAVSPDGRQIAAGGQESNWIFGAIVPVEVDGQKLGPWKPKP